MKIGSTIDRAVFRAWAVTLGVMLAVAALPVSSQDVYPSKRFELIVPFAAGSATDGVARILADGLSRQVGQPVSVVNRPGANGQVAVRALHVAPRDGYTMAILANGIVIEQVLKKGGDFDVRRDLVPVARATQAPYGLFASNSLPGNSLREVIDYARKNPGKINYASAAVGSSAHLTTERLMLATGMNLTHITYPAGTGAINVALMQGDVGLFINEMGSMRPLVNDKKIRLLATLDNQRSPIYPDSPSLADLDIPELKDFSASFFFGLFVAPGTDPARVERLAADINRVISEPATRGRLVALGYNPALLGGTTPAQFSKYMSDELARTEAVVQGAKLSIN